MQLDTPTETGLLFQHLPTTLFGPLASSARGPNARLLVALFRKFFSGELGDIRRKEEVVAFIGLELERGLDGDEAFDEAELSRSGRDKGQRAAILYRRLLDSGWIVEHRQGYVTLVDVEASVSMLLETLVDIEDGEAVHFGGTIAAIESVIEKLGEAPRDKAPSLAESAQRARRFQQHLSAVIGSLRAYEKVILEKPDPGHILEKFFDEFVEKLLIADYRALKTKNNPFRYRDRILGFVGDYENDAAMIDALSAGYVDQGLAPTQELAFAKVRQHLLLVKTVFGRAEERLDDIDAFRMRLEKKITRTITYMSQVDATISTRVAGLIQRVANRFSDWESPVAVPSDLADPCRTWGPAALATPRSRRAAARSTLLLVKENDPALTAYDGLKRDYLTRLTVTEEKLSDYLERNLGARETLTGDAFEILDTQDAVLFQRVRVLDALGYADLNSRFRIVRLEGTLLDTEWTTCTDFRIERRIPSAGDAAHAG